MRVTVFLLTVLLVAAGCGGTTARGTPYQPPHRATFSLLLGDGLSPRACASWMSGVLVGVCDPKIVRKGFSATLERKGDVRVSVTGRTVHGGGNAHLAQFAPSDGSGAPLGPDNVVTVSGHVADSSFLYLRGGELSNRIYAAGDAIFSGLRLAHGGTDTVRIAVTANGITYRLRRADGSTEGPLRVGGVAGPGVAVPVRQVPDAYVSTPAVTASTYVAAANALDGKTLCGMFTEGVARKYEQGTMPCWATVTAYIGFTGENNPRSFKDERLISIGHERHHGSYVGVPLNLGVYFTPTQYMPQSGGPPLFQRVRDVVWLVRQGSGWRVAKPSLAMMAAAAIDRGSSPLAPP